MVVAEDPSRMNGIVGRRKNLHFTGTTSGTSLMECFKSDLKSVPVLPTSEKHAMMGAARVLDETRSTEASGSSPATMTVLLLSQCQH